MGVLGFFLDAFLNGIERTQEDFYRKQAKYTGDKTNYQEWRDNAEIRKEQRKNIKNLFGVDDSDDDY